jgi:hypothetical protein
MTMGMAIEKVGYQTINLAHCQDTFEWILFRIKVRPQWNNAIVEDRKAIGHNFNYLVLKTAINNFLYNFLICNLENQLSSFSNTSTHQ